MMRTLMRWAPLVCGLLSFFPHHVLGAGERSVALTPALVRAGMSDDKVVVAHCVHATPGGKTPILCVYPMASSTSFMLPGGQLLTTPAESDQWIKTETNNLLTVQKLSQSDRELLRAALFGPVGSTSDAAVTIYLEDAGLPPAQSEAQAKRASYAQGLFKKIVPRLEDAAAARAALQTAFSQPLDNKGRVSGVDLGMPILHTLARFDGGPALATIGQRLERLGNPEELLPLLVQLDATASPLERSLVTAPIRKELVKVLTSRDVATDRPATLSQIQALKATTPVRERAAATMFPQSMLSWITLSVIGIALLWLGTVLGGYLEPGAGIARRRAVNAVESRGGLPRMSSNFDKAPSKADLLRLFHESAIWLDLKGGYIRALEILETVNDSRSPQKSTQPSKLERLAYELRKEVTGLREQREQAIHRHMQELDTERGKTRSLEKGLSEQSTGQAQYMARVRELLTSMFQDGVAYDAERFLQAAGRSLPASVQDAIDRAKRNASDLDDTGASLHAFPAANEGWSQTSRHVAVARALTASSVASRLEQIVFENGLMPASEWSTSDVHVGAIEAEFLRSRQDRDLTKRTADDYSRARGMLEGAIKAGVAGPSSTLTELATRILDSHSKLTRLRFEQEKALADLGSRHEKANADLASQTVVMDRLRSERETVDQTLSLVLKKFAGLDQAQLVKTGLFDTASSHLLYTNIQRLVAVFDQRLLAVKYVADALAEEMAVLRQRSRSDMVEALHLQRIVIGLTSLQERCVAFHAESAGRVEKEALFRRVLAPCLQEGWLHLLLRADCIGSPYWKSVADFQSLVRIVTIASLLAELLLADTDTTVIRPQLLSATFSDVNKQFGAEPSFKALPEVRAVVTPYVDRGESVAVDVFEVGIESPYVKIAPCVIALNPAEWRQ